MQEAIKNTNNDTNHNKEMYTIFLLSFILKYEVSANCLIALSLS